MTGQLLASHFPTRRAILFPNGTLYSNAERRRRRQRPRQSNIVPRSATIINYESLFAILPSMFLSSPKFFLSKTSVSPLLPRFFESFLEFQILPFKNECLSFVSMILRIFPRVPNSSFPKLMSLFYFHDSSSSSKFFLFKTSVFYSF